MSLQVIKMSEVEPSQQWKPGVRQGDVEWTESGDIHLHVYGDGSVYEIASGRWTTDTQNLGWLFHVHRKKWRDRVLFDLIDLFAAHADRW